MTQPKYSVTWRTLILMPIGLAAFFAYIYIFRVDIQDIVANARGINIDFYAFATVVAVLDTLLRKLRANEQKTRLSCLQTENP